jgi:F-type H+-transporting ATPase subunit a
MSASLTFFTPLEQFEIIPLIVLGLGEYLAFTNSSFFLVIILGIIFTLFYLSVVYKPLVVPNAWQSLVESFYYFILDMIQDTIGNKGFKYFPFVFVTFIFILFSNLLGMIPYTFTVTSHVIITFSLGLSTFFGITIIGFKEHGLHFFSFFLPPGAPLAMAPFLVLIELVSYLFRGISLSIRLFANMMAGHTLLKILAGFGWLMLSAGGIFYVLHLFPLIVVFALTGLELGIACLQAYVWTVLVCIYLNDALHLH